MPSGNSIYSYDWRFGTSLKACSVSNEVTIVSNVYAVGRSEFIIHLLALYLLAAVQERQLCPVRD